MRARRERYRELLQWAHQGEIDGQALIRALRAHGRFRGRDKQLGLLLELEVVTAGLLQPLLEREGIRPGVDAGPPFGADDGSTVPLADWMAFLGWTCDIAVEALPKFQELVSMAPRTDEDVLELVLQHEEALLEFAQGGLLGRPEAAAPIERFLSDVEKLRNVNG